MNNMQKAFKKKSSLRCMAEGGAVYKSDVGGVPTFSDAPGSGALYTPGSPVPAPSTYMKAGGTGAIGSQPSSIGANRAEIGAGRAPIGAGSAPIGGMRPPIGAMRPEVGAGRSEIGAPRMGALGRPIMTSVGYASGGKVRGPGGPTEDKVPAMLSPGEFVVRAAAVDEVGVDTLNKINSLGEPQHKQSKLRGNVRKYSAGGEVLPKNIWGVPQPAVTVTTPTMNPQVANRAFFGPGTPTTVNVQPSGPVSGLTQPPPKPAVATMGRGTVPPGAPAIPQNTAAERIINNNLIAQQGAGIPKQPTQVTLGAAKAAPAAVAPAAAPVAAAPAAQAAAKPGLLARGGSALTGWGKGLVNGAAKLATPVVATYGAVQAIGDNNNGYADYRGDGGGAGGHTGRVLETLGNALTGGYAEKLVQGMGATLEGDDFSAGWNLPTRRDEYLANRRDPITNALPSASGQAGYVAPGKTATDAAVPAAGATSALQAGVTQRPDGIYQQGNSFSNVLGADGKPQFLQERVGPPSPASEAYLARTPEMAFGPVPSGPGSSLRSGRGGGGMRLNMPSASDAALRSINARFDKLAENYAKNADPMSPSKTARTMADLEQARTNALNGVMGNDTNRRGQDMAASSAAARDAAGLEQEGMRGQFALLSGQAAANLAAQKAEADQAGKFTKIQQDQLAQEFPDPVERGAVARMYAANPELVGDGPDGFSIAKALLEQTNGQVMTLSGLANESIETGPIDRLIADGLGESVRGLAPWAEDNVEGYFDEAGAWQTTPKRKLSEGARSTLNRLRKDPRVGRERP